MSEMNGAIRRLPPPPPLPAESWEDGALNTAETAALLRVSTRTVYAMTRRGDLPYAMLGNSRRYPRRLVLGLLGSEPTR